MIKGFACGVFDLFHAGHVLMLKECRENCDFLVIGLNKAENISVEINPNKMAPIFPLEQRQLILESNRYVDEVVVYETEDELLNIMNEGDFKVRFLGDDYRNKPITGPNAIPKVHYLNRDHGLSTSGFKRTIADSLNRSTPD